MGGYEAAAKQCVDEQAVVVDVHHDVNIAAEEAHDWTVVETEVDHDDNATVVVEEVHDDDVDMGVEEADDDDGDEVEVAMVVVEDDRFHDAKGDSMVVVQLEEERRKEVP